MPLGESEAKSKVFKTLYNLCLKEPERYFDKAELLKALKCNGEPYSGVSVGYWLLIFEAWGFLEKKVGWMKGYRFRKEYL